MLLAASSRLKLFLTLPTEVSLKLPSASFTLLHEADSLSKVLRLGCIFPAVAPGVYRLFHNTRAKLQKTKKQKINFIADRSSSQQAQRSWDVSWFWSKYLAKFTSSVFYLFVLCLCPSREQFRKNKSPSLISHACFFPTKKQKLCDVKKQVDAFHEIRDHCAVRWLT